MNNNCEKEVLAGATVCGEHHKLHGTENQDAIGFAVNDSGMVMCVADGVGSHIYSAEGSKSAVAAVMQVFALLAQGGLDQTAVTEEICALYMEGIPAEHLGKAATTCIYIAVVEQRIYVGLIGDGVCCLRKNGEMLFVSRKDDDFSNIVYPLSVGSTLSSWELRCFDITEYDTIEALIATDGISVDIIPGKEGVCLDYFIRKISETPGENRNVALSEILTEWGTDGSSDDKSVIVYKRQGEKNGCY